MTEKWRLSEQTGALRRATSAPETHAKLLDMPGARRFYEAEGWHFDGTEKVDNAQGAVVNECRYAVDLPRPNEPDHR